MHSPGAGFGTKKGLSANPHLGDEQTKLRTRRDGIGLWSSESGQRRLNEANAHVLWLAPRNAAYANKVFWFDDEIEFVH